MHGEACENVLQETIDEIKLNQKASSLIDSTSCRVPANKVSDKPV